VALNNRAYQRIATRFSRLFVKPSFFKQDPTNFGVYGGSQLLVIQAPPGQTANIIEIWDSAGNVIYSIGPSGRPVPNAPLKPVTGGTANSLANIAVPAGAMVGGIIHYTVSVTDGTNFQSLSGMVTYAGVNKGGTITGAITEVTANQAEAVTGASTLSLTWTIVAGAGILTIKVQPNTSLTPTALNVAFTITPIIGAATIL
jgi:hypothetical protein